MSAQDVTSAKLTDYCVATAPGLHRLPSAPRAFTLRAFAAVSIECVEEHPPIPRDRFRQMLGDGADASQASRVLMRH